MCVVLVFFTLVFFWRCYPIESNAILHTWDPIFGPIISRARELSMEVIYGLWTYSPYLSIFPGMYFKTYCKLQHSQIWWPEELLFTINHHMHWTICFTRLRAVTGAKRNSRVNSSKNVIAFLLGIPTVVQPAGHGP